MVIGFHAVKNVSIAHRVEKTSTNMVLSDKIQFYLFVPLKIK